MDANQRVRALILYSFFKLSAFTLAGVLCHAIISGRGARGAVVSADDS